MTSRYSYVRMRAELFADPDRKPRQDWRWDRSRAWWVPGGDWAGVHSVVVKYVGRDQRWYARARGAGTVATTDTADRAKVAIEAWVEALEDDRDGRPGSAPPVSDPAVRRFRAAVAELRVLLHDHALSLYVANDTLCLMRGPSHDDNGNPLRENVVDTAPSLRISGGDW